MAQTNLEFWQSGVDLSSAAIKYAESDDADAYRNSSKRSEFDFYQTMLYASLFEKLQRGGLVAFGFRSDLPPNDEPERLARSCFMDRPVASDCHNDELKIGDWHYRKVRVMPCGDTALESIPPLSGNSEAKSLGRRNTYQYVKECLIELYKIDGNDHKSAAKIYPDFCIIFEKKFPRKRYLIDIPSERTLRTHMKRFRKEMEETGRNEISI